MPDYFTLDELNALPDMPEFDDSQYEAAGSYIEGVIEREVRTSFVPRTVVEVHDGGRDHIVLLEPWILSVTSATEDGVTVADSLVVRHGILRKVSGASALQWSCGYGNVVVTYEAGYSSEPPADIKAAALYGARAWLLANSEFAGMDARRTSISTDMGVVNFVTAGEDRPTGYPEVDSVILGWREKLRAPSVA